MHQANASLCSNLESAANHIASLHNNLLSTARTFKFELSARLEKGGTVETDIRNAFVTIFEALTCKELDKIENASAAVKNTIITTLKAYKKKAMDCPIGHVWESLHFEILGLIDRTTDLRKRRRTR